MAELEEIGEIFSESSEGIEAEAAEGEAADEELATEAKEATENVSVLERGVDALKKLDVPQSVKSFAKFVCENAAIGAVLYGVNVLMAKVFGKATGGEKQAVQKKQKKVKAVAQLTSDVANILNKLAKWTKAKENLTVDVGDGITVPFPDILSKFTKPMEQNVQSAFDISKQLVKKDGSAKPTFVVPTTGQVNQMIDSSAAIITSLQTIVTFANDKKKKYPDLGTLPLGQGDVQKLNSDVGNIKKLPYA